MLRRSKTAGVLPIGQARAIIGAMTGADGIRRIRKSAKIHGVAVRFAARYGQGMMDGCPMASALQP
jgi:hypothetical protein